MRRHLILMTATAGLAALSLTVAACGGSSDSAESSTSTPSAVTTAPEESETAAAPAATAATTSPATATKVIVVMGKPKEFSLSAVPVQVAAGPTTFAVTNRGSILHEMVVVPSAGGAAALRQPDGTASEAGTVGEVPDVEPGAGGKLTVTLPAGTYVLLCNLPGHFAGGMYAPFVVK